MSKTNIIMLISDDIELATKIAKDIWYTNTNYAIFSSEDGYDYSVKHFISEEYTKAIMITSGKWITQRRPNSFLDYCKKYQVTPFFITRKDTLGDAHLIYSNLENCFPDSTEYIHNDQDEKTYQTELNILKTYLW